jgi:glycosyltransferase involved in cell wall biosynthesis
MLNRKKIAAVVPAHNEAKLIGRVVKTMPSFVDLIIIINDGSTDNTAQKAKLAAVTANKKIKIINHKIPQGVGGAILAGFDLARNLKMDVMAVMAGDAQMDPNDLKNVVMPIVEGQADFVKGNRIASGRAWQQMPKIRYLGNSVLSLMTKMASGYWHVADSQTGYVAISREMIERIPLEKVCRGYGFENDILIYLNTKSARVKEVAVKPVYGIGEKSGMLLIKVGPEIAWLLAKRFFWRLGVKYVVEDFHPLVFFYFTSIILNISSLGLFIRMIVKLVETGNFPVMNTILFVFCAIMSSQFLFFAMWFDMEYNKDLKVK